MARHWLISGLLAVAAFAQIHTAAAQTNSYPRLGAYLIGGTIDFTNLPHIGNLQAAVFSNYPGYSAGGKNLQQQVAAVKAMNPSMKIATIRNIAEVSSYAQQSGAALSPEYQADITNNWWLRTSAPSGSIVISPYGADAVNIATTTLNSSGQTYLQWQASWSASFGPGLVPALDGIYTDVFQATSYDAGDYLQNGTTQSLSASTPLWQSTMVKWVSTLKAAMGPGYMVWGNLSTWTVSATPSSYNQLLNGGVMESAIGQSYSWESRSWSYLMENYANLMKILAPFQGGGPYAIFQQDGSITDYQGMRYGLASCLLDNGYYHFNTAGQGGGNNVAWFDEMGVSLGAPTAGPNNPANGTYSSGGLTVWQNGVYRRDFANGIALVNPKGNGVRTVTLETTYKHFSGTQDPSVNNGQSVSSVTLSDRDGVILLRTTQQPVPDPPTLTVQ